MSKRKDKTVARQGIILVMNNIEQKMNDIVINGASTGSIVGAFSATADLSGYADVISKLVDSVNKLS